MRKLIFIGFIVVGAAVGMLVAFDGDWGLRIVMMVIGAVVGAAIGGALAGIGTVVLGRNTPGLDKFYGLGVTQEDRDRNYWRDQGYPPFMRPPRSEPDRHMLDPDRFD